jgi:serine/threonine protein phosphatase 1
MMVASRCFVVGDIHGCLEETNRLLDSLAPSSNDTIVFLGDYIDRGPQSAGVISRMLRLRQEGPRCVFLKGNHEDMFLAFMGYEGLYGEAFLHNGGNFTVESYGLEHLPGSEVAARLPPDHLQFLLDLQLQHETGDFLCVHAGLDPQQPLAAQSVEDKLWIRGAFINHPHPFPFTVLFGHTPRREIVLDLPYKLGLDTGLVYSNKLSCFEISQKELFQIEWGEQRVKRRTLVKEFEAAPRR